MVPSLKEKGDTIVFINTIQKLLILYNKYNNVRDIQKLPNKISVDCNVQLMKKKNGRQGIKQSKNKTILLFEISLLTG